VKLHCPFAPVVHDPEVDTEPVTVKRTTISRTGLPPASVTVAVTVWLVPTGFVAAAGERTSVAGAPMSASFTTKASSTPPNAVWKAPGVVGKLVENVRPVT